MTETAHDSDFSLNMRRETAFENLEFVNSFNGDTLSCEDVSSMVDLGKSSTTEKLAEFVFAEENSLGQGVGTGESRGRGVVVEGRHGKGETRVQMGIVVNGGLIIEGGGVGRII
ncbi:hypothetical protein CSA_017391, partial [Cucumis sativus]